MAGTELFAQPYSRFLALGVGERGGRASSLGCTEGLGDASPWAACDSDASALLATGLEQKLHIPRPARGARGPGAQGLAAQAEELERLAGRRTVTLIFGALAEPAAGFLMPLLAAGLRAQGRLVIALGLEPFGFEGPEGMARAGAAADTLARESDLLLLLAADSILDERGGEIPVAQAYREAERALTGAAQALLGAWAGEGSGPGATPEGLAAALRGSGGTRAALGRARGPRAPQEAVRSALQSDWIRNANRGGESRLALAVASGREVLLAEARELICEAEQAGGLSVSPYFCLGVDSALGDEARALLMVHSLPANVLSLSSEPRVLNR